MSTHRTVLLLVVVFLRLSAQELLEVVPDRPIVVLAPGGAVVSLTAQASGFAPATVVWSQVRDRLNPRRAPLTAQITGTGLTATVRCPDPGVYQLQAVATGGAGPVVGTTWVQVWDAEGAVSPTIAMHTGPAMTPPTSVRRLSRSPAAYVHPRVLFSDADWAAMSARAASGRIARWGTDSLRSLVAANLDAPTSQTGALAAGLDAWASGTGPVPDLSHLADDGVLASETTAFASMLFAAAYLQWLDNDPALPLSSLPQAVQDRGHRLARILAAAATLRLRAVWDRPTRTMLTPSGTMAALAIGGLSTPGEPITATGLSDLAMAYDLLYGWMDGPQRTAVRELLVAAGYARHQAGGGFEPTGTSVTKVGRPKLGALQNGDFSNLNDHHLLLDLAVEGEIPAVASDVMAAFCTPASGSLQTQWVKAADPASDAAAWPLGSAGAVDGLEREARWLIDWYTTPWGLVGNHLSYWAFSAKHMLPTILAYARRGENLFVTSHLYQINLHALLVLHPAEGAIASGIKVGGTPLASSRLGWWDHHDSGSYAQRGTAALLTKYMYPDDPLVDYVYRAYLPSLDRDPFIASAFGIDPVDGVAEQTLPQVAAAKRLPLKIYDPQRGVVSLRSAWDDQALSVWFENNGSDPYAGHMHAEKNSFDFFALGRAWSIAPGYHMTISDAQAAVLIKDPRYAGDAATGGFIGESSSSATQVVPLPGNFPTPPGRLLAVEDDPAGNWTLVAGDATVPYTYGFRQTRNIDTKMPRSSFLPAGLIEDLNARSHDFSWIYASNLMVSQTDYNPVQYAIRSLLLVRGPRPYVLVVDDISKDGQPQDWRWTMNSGQGFNPGGDTRFIDAKGRGVYSSTVIQPGASASEAVLYHSPIDDGNGPGLPRLLVRELAAGVSSTHPAIVLESKPPGVAGIDYLTYGIDNNHPASGQVKVPTNRLLIERRGVATPDYTVLLFPYRTGEVLPATTWNSDRSRLRVDLGGGVVHTLRFDRTQADHRTRIAWAAGDLPLLTTTGPITGTVGTPLRTALTSSKPGAQFTSSILPAGLTLSSDGVLFGTPMVAGTSTVTVTVATAAGSTAIGLGFAIQPLPVVVDAPSVPVPDAAAPQAPLTTVPSASAPAGGGGGGCGIGSALTGMVGGLLALAIVRRRR